MTRLHLPSCAAGEGQTRQLIVESFDDMTVRFTPLHFEAPGCYYICMSNVAEIKNAAGGLVISNPDILGGTPVFRGTRLPVQTLFDYLADGLSLSYFLETFEGVSREQAQAVLRHGCDRIMAELKHENPA